MNEQYGDRVAFLFVYIREAHASDEWQIPEDDVIFEQPTTLGERRAVAATCCADLELALPCVVDEMDNAVDDAYAAWPERLFVVGADGKIAYSGSQGPWGFIPEHIEAWLEDHVGPPRDGA